MGGASARWVLLLALGLAIFRAIQCPHTDPPPASPGRSSSPLRSIGKSISRRLSRMRTGGSSRSGSGSDSDGERSGGDNKEMPLSGYGGGFHRSRSPSPTPGGGGGGGRRSGAGFSGAGSSSGVSRITKMWGAYSAEKIPNTCREINSRGAAQVINNMQVSVFAAILRQLRETVATGECKTNAGRGGRQLGSQKCQEMYGEFKKIEPQYRGECADAVSAYCHRWPATPGAPEEKKCTFFLQTGIRSANRLEGFYVSLEDCIEGIKHQIFMDDQLAGIGIKPPKSPPNPLLPPNYSPQY